MSITSTLCTAFSLTVLFVTKSVAEAAPPVSPGAVQPKIKEIHVEKVRALTGPEAPVSTKPLDICGTDLGTMTEIGNRIELREADNPWGPWSAPLMVASAGQYPQLYGAFMTPAFLKDNGQTLYFTMSMFGPYNTFVMKANLVADDFQR